MADSHPAVESRVYRVHGRVQGVGFRWWTRGVAEELGVVGSVQNLPDGSVEVYASASPSILDTLEARLNEGPRFSRVDRVECEVAEIDELQQEFRILQ